jgi:arabinose-5-phosphate isomerase
VTGVGKSGFIAMKMVATLVSLGKDAVYLNPLDALHGDSGIVRDGDVLILFSFSGSSPELIRLVKHFKKHFKIKVITVTGARTAPLRELSDGVITFSIAGEGCPLGLAPMASTTASLVIADCIASALTSPDEFKPEHFAKYHPAGTLGLSLTPVHKVMRIGKKIPKILAQASFEDALHIITLQKLVQIVGIVNEDNRLIGAFADGDIRRMILKHGDLRGKSISEIMNPNPRTVHQGDTLHAALSLMREYKVNNLFVIDDDSRYIGFIHIHDIIGD